MTHKKTSPADAATPTGATTTTIGSIAYRRVPVKEYPDVVPADVLYDQRLRWSREERYARAVRDEQALRRASQARRLYELRIERVRRYYEGG